jgi:hypothetical protein
MRLDDVDESTRALIMTRLIPAQQRHIATLDGMMRKIERMGDEGTLGSVVYSGIFGARKIPTYTPDPSPVSTPRP